MCIRDRCNRALVAGPAPRRDAIAQFDLSDWKSAVGAVTAVGYGQLPNGISGHDGLLQLVTEAKNQEIAGLLVKSFKAGYGDRRGQPGDYATSMAIRTLEEAVMPEGYRHPDILSSSLSGLADYCGLSTLAREYIYSGDGFAWLASTPLRYDLDAVLAQGWAEFDPAVEQDVRTILLNWAGLANQRGEDVPLPASLTQESVCAWAREVFSSSDKGEGSMESPRASCKVCLLYTSRCV